MINNEETIDIGNLILFQVRPGMYPPGPRPGHYPRPFSSRVPNPYGPGPSGPPSVSCPPGSSGQMAAPLPDSRFGPPQPQPRPPMPGPRPNHVSFESVKDEQASLVKTITFSGVFWCYCS